MSTEDGENLVQTWEVLRFLILLRDDYPETVQLATRMSVKEREEMLEVAYGITSAMSETELKS